MPQEKKKRYNPGGPGHGEDEEKRRDGVDDEIDDLLDDVEEIIKQNKENAKKKQPTRQ